MYFHVVGLDGDAVMARAKVCKGGTREAFPAYADPCFPGCHSSGGISKSRAGLVGGCNIADPRSPRIGANGAAENVLEGAPRKERAEGCY